MHKKLIYVLGGVYTAAILAFTVFVMLDAFVIERAYVAVHDTLPAQASSVKVESTVNDAKNDEGQADTDQTQGESSEEDGESSDRSYHRRHGFGGFGGSGGNHGSSSSSSDRTEEEINSATTSDEETTEVNGSVTLTTMRYLNTDIYVVDIYCSGTDLMSALANDVYGKNVTQTTSAMASAKGATVAINGDYYGARNEGYVVRNGTLYRSTSAGSSQEDLVIYADGTMEVIREGDVTAQELVDKGAWQVYSFGPGLVVDGAVSVSLTDEVDRATSSNPRTAIGQVGEGHYVFVVADGRTSASEGLSLYELATFMTSQLGVQTAYNLDGGGSSTLYLNGSVINNPSGGGVGSSSGERKVSDIVYVSF